MQFLILKDAKEIIQASNYGWGSGFSETAALLGQKQILKITMSQLLEL